MKKLAMVLGLFLSTNSFAGTVITAPTGSAHPMNWQCKVYSVNGTLIGGFSSTNSVYVQNAWVGMYSHTSNRLNQCQSWGATKNTSPFKGNTEVRVGWITSTGSWANTKAVNSPLGK
jgi:hypothetical protein